MTHAAQGLRASFFYVKIILKLSRKLRGNPRCPCQSAWLANNVIRATQNAILGKDNSLTDNLSASTVNTGPNQIHKDGGMFFPFVWTNIFSVLSTDNLLVYAEKVCGKFQIYICTYICRCLEHLSFKKMWPREGCCCTLVLVLTGILISLSTHKICVECSTTKK